jgi:hypothetical protein
MCVGSSNEPPRPQEPFPLMFLTIILRLLNVMVSLCRSTILKITEALNKQLALDC